MKRAPDAIAVALEMLLLDLRGDLGDRSARFRALIGADLARQLRAELEHASSLAKSRQETLRRLGSETEAELCAAIRDRRVDLDEARAALLAWAKTALSAIHPRFDTRVDLP